MDWIGLLGKKERQPTFCLGFLMGYNSYIGLSTSSDGDAKKKSLFTSINYHEKFGFPPATIKSGTLPPSTFQTVHFTSLEWF